MEATPAPELMLYVIAGVAGFLSFILFNCLPYLFREALDIYISNAAVVIAMIVSYIPFYFGMRAHFTPEYSSAFPWMVAIFVGVSGMLELTLYIFEYMVDENGHTRSKA